MGDGTGGRGFQAALAASRATGVWTDGSLRQTVNLKCRLIHSTTVIKFKYVGLDVHAETVDDVVVDSSREVRAYGNIPAHTHTVDKLVGKQAEGGTEVRAVYEACGLGHTLHEELTATGARSRVGATTRYKNDRLETRNAGHRARTDPGRDFGPRPAVRSGNE